jgi:hypothetical protein
MAQDKKATTAAAATDTAPDRRPLNKLQAMRLSALADIDAKQLHGQTVLELSDKLKWRVDPNLFFFRRVCGQVVKKDPVTGVAYPVPFATVIVEDTDCTLLSYFPIGWKWGWHFPLACHREVLATVKTDKCGRFCVYIPRFDIDWILRWRHERICFPDIFVRPDLNDLVRIPEPRPPFRIPPGDPAPFEGFAGLRLSAAEALGGVPGRQLAQRAADFQTARSFGARNAGADHTSAPRAFPADLPPPLPAEFQQLLAGGDRLVSSKDAKPADALRNVIATHAGVAPGVLDQLDLSRFAGPFRRCIDLLIPEWQVIVDVPDITFRVTQDTNGDGVEETIYSEGFFDVRWDAGAIPDLTLVASSAARETRVCESPVVPCGNVPELLFAGLMPLSAAYFDVAQGYAKRPNRPKPPVGPRPVAQTPLLGTLQLYGCVNVAQAAFYRVVARAAGSATFSAITGLSWNIYPIPSGAPHLVAADASGWYPVLANPASFHPANMVLEWPTPSLGRVELKIEVANAAKATIASSSVVAIQVDNTLPSAPFDQLAWKFSSEDDSAFDLPQRNLLVACPVIRRGAVAQEVQVQFKVSVNAHHLRDAHLYTRDCGGGSFALISDPALATHWHETTADNAVVLTGRYRLSTSALEGAYGFGCQAISRAMNPSGGDGGHLADWNYDPVFLYVQPDVEIAVVNG